MNSLTKTPELCTVYRRGPSKLNAMAILSCVLSLCLACCLLFLRLLVLDYLPAPTVARCCKYWLVQMLKWVGLTHYLLGKKRPGSGILCRYSTSALSFQPAAVMRKMARPAIAVLRFQLAGCAYQPPDGDQTCLGYLEIGSVSREGR